MNERDTVSCLNKLIETSRDGEQGFRTAAEHLHRQDIKDLFLRRADECRQAVAELQSLVVSHGGTAEDSGSASGKLHRGWVALKAKLSGDSDTAILEETERGEDVALERYREALEESLPVDVRTTVERQYEGVKRNHLQVRTLRDQLRSTAHR
jgi:uncharacterized protein (TIGR02284 family)